MFAALTTGEGLRSWWTDDATAEAREGTIAEFGFGNRATVFHMRVASLAADRRVVWDCVGDPEEWAGTHLTWELAPTEGGTDLRFTHANWRPTQGAHARCNIPWGALMHRLKACAERKAPGPLFAASP